MLGGANRGVGGLEVKCVCVCDAEVEVRVFVGLPWRFGMELQVGEWGRKWGCEGDMGLQAGDNIGASWDAREVAFGCERGCMRRCKLRM